MHYLSGDNLEVGSVAGAAQGKLYFRCFASEDGDTVMDQTFIVEHDGHEARLLRTLAEECTAILSLQDGRLACLGAFGNLYFYRDGHWQDVPADLTPSWYLNGLWEFGRTLFAAGTHGRLLRWDQGRWLALDTPDPQTDILDMATTADGQPYCVGSDGFLARILGHRAERIALPTNVEIKGIAADPGGRLLLCGARGSLWRGMPEHWQELDTADRESDFYAIRQWNGRCFVSAETEILLVGEEELTVHAELESFGLIAAGDSLWNIGLGTLHRLDDETWAEFPVEFDVDTGPLKQARRKT